jgi:hypothetical protein
MAELSLFEAAAICFESAARPILTMLSFAAINVYTWTELDWTELTGSVSLQLIVVSALAVART